MSDQPLRQAVIEAGDKARDAWRSRPPTKGDDLGTAISVAAVRTALEHVRKQMADRSVYGVVAAWDILDDALAQLTPAGEEPTKGTSERPICPSCKKPTTISQLLQYGACCYCSEDAPYTAGGDNG